RAAEGGGAGVGARAVGGAAAAGPPARLPGGGLSPQLGDELAALSEGRGAARPPLRQQPAARIDREPAADAGDAVGQPLAGVALRAQAELLVGEQLTRGVGVLALDDVEVGRSQA